MRLNILLAISLLSGLAFATPGVTPFSTFSKVTIFTPPATYTDPRVLYARTVELDGGVLLATWVSHFKPLVLNRESGVPVETIPYSF
jgi:hypothetical protein